VKQRYAFKQFIAINDDLEVDARVLYQSEWGRDQDIGETEIESVCVRDSRSLKEKDSVGHKLYSWRKHLVMDMSN
jgi:hypothetical protein